MNIFSKNALAALVLLGTFALPSCSDDFLNDPQPTDTVSEIDAFSSESSIRAYFTGVYNRMRSDYLNHDTDGAKSYDLAFEVMGDDFIQPFFNWYGFDYEIDNSRSTYRRVSYTWDFHYRIVNHANVILQGIQTAPISDAARTSFEAEARALRAWAYFNLIRAYQHTYLHNPNAPGVPIYTQPTSAENRGAPRASVEEVYQFMIQDLTFATQNLPATRSAKHIVNNAVASGLLARVYLTKGDWANAESAAFDALAGYGVTKGGYTQDNITQALRAAEYREGFNNYNAHEWLWGLPLRNDQTLFYRSFYSHIDHYRTDGYQSIYVNSAFVNLFSETDVRNLFEVHSSNDYHITTKFRDLPDLSGHFVMMRSAEMVLIIAEAQAEQNNLQNAKDVLFALQRNRDPQAVMSASITLPAIIEEILVERRKELYGEQGVMIFDLKRRQLPLVRTGNHAAALLGEYPANYTHFIYQIPQVELDSNDFIGPEDQNP